MTTRIPKYNHLPAHELPPYQLFKRWQTATKTSTMAQFGSLTRIEMLASIKKYKPELLKGD